MEKRTLGKSDLSVSKMGLGCMSLGTDSANAEKIIKAALDEGINYFDTADLYNYGVNEELVGKALASIRDQVVIATKVGNRWTENKDGWSWDPSKKYIKEAVKKSLKRLGTDYIDLYQLHGGTIDDPIDETIEAFEELKSEGFIRYYGISSIRPNVIREYVDRSSIVSVMMQYSLLDRRPEEVMASLKENGVSVVTRGSVAKGLLSDTILSIKENQWEGKEYLDYSSNEIKELIESIQAKLLHDKRSLNELALQFNLANKAVAAVVTGASTIEQIKDNARAVNSTALTKEEWAFLHMVTRESHYTAHR
ncbi:D-threo-aldose 1-dehydrogenase [Siminovitchia terrae]|uniref:D-threo-aldose 1-dehydrogenase n=1 Tax=Siminovitchia terrae TaxID=1914933 RepID=A0ABQ4KWN8_SIMTE|nr:aldo/keto reductase [Siminovitchia terrae]GIN96458.1 D-threo-aldose 1-dehydrogenase [Siminovitchia terrae]